MYIIMRNIVLSIFSCVIVFEVIAAIYYTRILIYRKFLRYETVFSDVKITKVKLSSGCFHPVILMIEKTWMDKTDDENNTYYKVECIYEGKKYCTYTTILHYSVGNIVPVEVHKGYNKKGKIKDVYFDYLE